MKNTTEGNKLIAEFMGIDFVSENSRYIVTELDYLETYHHNYHTSWAAIMQAVEKIETMTESFNIHKNTVSIYIDSDSYIVKVIFNEDGTSAWKYYPDMNEMDVIWSNKEIVTKIESVWFAVCEFIEWYNKYKTA